MDVATIIVSGLSAIVALGSLWWARTSARASNRSAVASERSAAAAERSVLAEERTAQAANDALALERERAVEERRDRQARNAPTFELPGFATLTPSRAFELVVHNKGGAGLITKAMLAGQRTPQVAWPPRMPPMRIETGGSEILTFEAVDVDPGVDDQLTVILEYRADGGEFRAAAGYTLRRAGSDVSGAPMWERGETLPVRRLDLE